ncbi:hypothetical protein HOP60_09670 [Halomonas daqingensis]|uniref:Uncharacterized protein n=1 Tax=Billgrantia desiderata TaxID=52021 RepID=A0ABS9B5S0_9GAMM|nr:hypothetical protein [Halomonas desiderata]MCE8042421.1 hypothetical protein [Halomonas desiderata]MCE8046996.1 hypothetical protein [Halomonas desiderata]
MINVSTSPVLFIGGRLDGKVLRVQDALNYFETLPDQGSIYDLDLSIEPKNEPEPLIVYKRCERLPQRDPDEPAWVFRLVEE